MWHLKGSETNSIFLKALSKENNVLVIYRKNTQRPIVLTPCVVSHIIACLHDQNKVAFLEGRLLSSQSEQSENFSKSPDWLEKSRPSFKVTFALIM